MKRIMLATMLVLVIGAGAIAQVAAPGVVPGAATSEIELQQRLQLAISSEKYPVTPGDVYRLTYTQADTQVINNFLVESDYTINMKVFGKMNTTGMTFMQLKPLVEKAVAAAYPRSMPSLAIYSLGIFQVQLKGETPQAQSVIAWGLSKLSEIVESRSGRFASLRNIRVISRDGKEKTLDLFKAYRIGAVEEDPYVKPGDTIMLSRSERRIEIAGEVHWPGTYDLLADEQLRELVETYGGGLTGNSDVSRVRIERMAGDRARIVYVSLSEGYRQGARIENGDVITIPALTESLPVVSFEGAVIRQAAREAVASAAVEAAQAAEAGVTPEYHRIIYTYKDGETLSDALRAIKDSIAPLADLSSASVLREGISEPIVVDLRDLLTSSISPVDMVMKANDRIVIPYLRFSVFVSGAVEAPGTYPYAPGRTYHYYVALAGGSSQDAPDNIYITDVNGNMRDQKEAIQSEDRIFLIPAEVMVQGAVFAPGRFSYREGLPVSYYVNLAGGIDPERNGGRKARHYDSSGNRQKAGAPVMPGDRLYVPNNDFFYTFNRYVPILLMIVDIIYTSVEVYNLMPR
jgi:polysaccharide biosynthesis/export protein